MPEAQDAESAVPPTSNDLMKELNGGGTQIERVDDAPAQSQSREDELTVGPKAQPSAVAQMDKRFSTVSGGKGYSVIVVGEYRAKDPGSRDKAIKKAYEVEVRLPKLDAALSVIRNRLIVPAVKKKHEDCVSVRTIYIKKTTPLSAETPETRNLQYMNYEQLINYVKEIKIPMDLEVYSDGEKDVTALREAIIDWTQNPKGFEKREAERRVKREEDRELAALNPELVQ